MELTLWTCLVMTSMVASSVPICAWNRWSAWKQIFFNYHMKFNPFDKLKYLQVQHARGLLGVDLVLVILPPEVVPHSLGHVGPVNNLR